MQNTYQEKILDLETTNNSPRVKLEGGIKFKIKILGLALSLKEVKSFR